MILPDLNLLIYAYNIGARDHVKAKAWWEGLMTRRESVCLVPAVALGFIRLMTNAKIVEPPMALDDAISEVKRWLAAPNVTLLQVTAQHWNELHQIGWTGANVSDAHLAAMAITHGCELHSNDAIFSRCPTLRWKNPLVV